MKPKRITLRWLKAHDACESQVDIFKRVFPRGADITNANIAKARRHRLQINWLALKVSDDEYCPCQRCMPHPANVIRKAYGLPRPRK